ncbi:hypothetical protein BDV96DRAFT_655858 [Lophiotrema nucula]|uniref:Uncharacterized protein n=1 Tax=Lophiotrema nucula TaxID=690887 RepID=A0A6A5YFV9_9PLEO|nr:hypothetical protein BDV96DRAFT_655858 [Lophiotrema nucula]
MAISFDVFNSSRAEAHSKFISYTGPPAPKSHSGRRAPKAAAPIIDGHHALDNGSTVTLRMEPNPENEGSFVSASSNPYLANLSDGHKARDFGTDDRVGDDSDNFDFGFHLQDEARSVGCVLSQSPNAMQRKSADQSQIQPTFAGDSIAGNGENEEKDGEGNNEVDSDRSSERGYDFNYNATRSHQHKRIAASFRQSGLIEDLCDCKTDKWSTQPVIAYGGSCGNATSIVEDNQPEHKIGISDGDKHSLRQSDKAEQLDSQL